MCKSVDVLNQKFKQIATAGRNEAVASVTETDVYYNFYLIPS